MQAGFYFPINTLQELSPGSSAQEITLVPSNLNLQLVGKEPKDTNALAQTRCSQDLEGEGQSSEEAGAGKVVPVPFAGCKQEHKW